MLKKAFITLITVSLLFALPAFAKKGASGGCKAKDVAGSYTRTISGQFGDGHGGLLDRVYIRQLSLGQDGIAHQTESSAFDVAHSFQIRTDWTGSWTCRDDGKVLVTVIGSILEAVPEGTYAPSSPDDHYLQFNTKTSYLFQIVDNNTLQLEQSAARYYDMLEDPQDPGAGFIIGGGPSAAIYNRLVPDDSDL